MSKLNAVFQHLSDNSLNIIETSEMIEVMFNTNQNMFLWGNPGIGKTQSVMQFGAKQQLKDPNFKVWYMTLSHLDPTDLSGLPTFDEEEVNGKKIKVTKWAVPDFYPKDPNAKGVLFLDEYNNASGAVQNACQQLIQERRIGDYKLPEGIFIIAAGNPTGQNAFSTELSAPTRNRFAHFFVRADFEIWADYFLAQRFDLELTKAVLGFLKQNPQYFEDEKAMDDGELNYGTPRNWIKLSKVLAKNWGRSKEVTASIVSGFIGNEGAQSFVEYLDDMGRYQDPMEIINGKDFQGTDEIGYYKTMYGVYATLYSWLGDKNKQKDIGKGVKNLLSAAKRTKKADFITATSKKIAHAQPLLDLADLSDYIEAAKAIKVAKEME